MKRARRPQRPQASARRAARALAPMLGSLALLVGLTACQSAGSVYVGADGSVDGGPHDPLR